MNIKNLLKQLPVQLVLIIAFVALFGDKLPLSAQQFFLGLSICIKEVLIFILPAIIFALIFNSMVQMSSGAIRIIFVIFAAIIVSNFAAIWFSYGVSKLFLGNINLAIDEQTTKAALGPMFQFDIGVLVPNEYALLSGLFLGILSMRYYQDIGKKIASKLVFGANYFLMKIFVPLVPLLILGMMIQLQYEGKLDDIVLRYFAIIGLVIVTGFAYICLVLFFANKFDLKATISCLKKLTPAGITALCTMSSAAALPLALKATKEHLEDENTPSLVMSASVNAHLIGDSIATPMLMMAVLMSFGGEFFSLSQFLLFSGYYVLVRFAGAAVPGGSIVVVLPILDNNFGFSTEMTSLIFAIYVLSESFNSAYNIIGNSAIAIAFKNYLGGLFSFGESKKVESSEVTA